MFQEREFELPASKYCIVSGGGNTEKPREFGEGRPTSSKDGSTSECHEEIASKNLVTEAGDSSLETLKLKKNCIVFLLPKSVNLKQKRKRTTHMSQL